MKYAVRLETIASIPFHVEKVGFEYTILQCCKYIYGNRQFVTVSMVGLEFHI